MINEKYSAGLVSQSFWFVEFKKIVKLVAAGVDESEIKRMCLEENIFGASKEYRAKRMYGYIWSRVKRLDETMMNLFLTSDLQTQKIINFITVLQGDRLYFEFLFEVYREKVLLGIPTLEDRDVNIFFNKKEIEADKVATFTETTKKRLRSVYFNFMIDANLLSVVNKEKTITPPILDIALEHYLEAIGDDSIAKAITGVS